MCIEVIDIRSMPYRQAWQLQKDLFAGLVEQKKKSLTVDKEYILIAEHPPVFTLGKHGKAGNMLLSNDSLIEKGAELIEIERGGDITFHGPGQLVLYPIIDLSKHSLGVRKYVEILEESIIRLLKKYDIKGERVEGASGVWIDVGTTRERKICALGIKCSHFITMHGLALNVSTDLSWFNLINPCGFVDKGVTSIQKEIPDKDVSFNQIADELVDIFKSLIGA